MLLDDLAGYIRVHFAVDGGGHVGHSHFHGGLYIAETHAPGLPDYNVLVHVKLLHGCEDGVEGRLGARGDPAGSHADDDLHALSIHVAAFEIFLPLVPQRAKIFQGHLCHIALLTVRILNSQPSVPGYSRDFRYRPTRISADASVKSPAASANSDRRTS